MEALKMQDGEIIFGKKVDGLEEFIQRWINTLKIDASECFYNERLGISKSILFGEKSNRYKLEYLKNKTLELYRDELEDLYYKVLSENNRILRANFYFLHKIYKEFEKEVEISAN